MNEEKEVYRVVRGPYINYQLCKESNKNNINDTNNEFLDYLFKMILGAIIAFPLVATPVCLVMTHNDVQQLNVYWEQSIEPYIVEEYEDYVVITCPEAGLWQAGSHTLANYNEDLRENRRWATHPIFNPVFNNAPSYLKYARIEKDAK